MSARLGDHSTAPNMLRHIPAVCFLMGSALLPGNMLQVLECEWKHTALTQEVRSSGQAWSSYILETRQFLLDRRLKTLLMPFLPQKKIAFPELCVLRVSHFFKVLAWSPSSRHNSPEADSRERHHTHRERQSIIPTSVPSQSLCRRDPVSVGLSGNFLESMGSHHESPPGYRILMAKFAFLSQCLKLVA